VCVCVYVYRARLVVHPCTHVSVNWASVPPIYAIAHAWWCVGDRFVVVASDGVWDVMSDQEACEAAARALLPPTASSSTGGGGSNQVSGQLLGNRFLDNRRLHSRLLDNQLRDNQSSPCVQFSVVNAARWCCPWCCIDVAGAAAGVRWKLTQCNVSTART
jgi:hypothetical protein